MRMLALLLLLLASCASARAEVAPDPETRASPVEASEPDAESAPEPQPEVTYVVEVRTEPEHAIWVEVQTPGMSSGRTRFLIPSRYGPLGGIPKLIEDFEARDESGTELEWTVDLDKGMWTVSHAPEANLIASYRLGDKDEPARKATANFYRPFVDGGLMHVFGSALFVAPEQVSTRGEHRVRVEFEGFDKIGDNLVSSFHVGTDPLELTTTMTGLRRGVFYAGRDLRIVERKVGAHPVYAAISGDFEFEDQQFADLLAKVVETQRDYFDDHSMKHMLVSVLPNNERINPETPGQGSSGTGIVHGFALFMREETDFENPEHAHWTRHLLTHELLHNWINGSVVSMPDQPGTFSAWFGEGFTTYLTGELMREAGLVDEQGFLTHVNDYVRGYQKNPHRELPNEESAPLFWKGKEGHDLPYQRGALIAAHIDREMRKSGSKTLGDLLEEIYVETRKTGPLTPDEFFEKIAENTSKEFAAKTRGWALEGKIVPLSEDLFGDAFTTATRDDLQVYVSVE